MMLQVSSLRKYPIQNPPHHHQDIVWQLVIESASSYDRTISLLPHLLRFGEDGCERCLGIGHIIQYPFPFKYVCNDFYHSLSCQLFVFLESDLKGC